MGLSLKKRIGDVFSRSYDQLNPLDNGRTWQNRQGNGPSQPSRTVMLGDVGYSVNSDGTPFSPPPSAIHQLTHNAITNTYGNVFVKPMTSLATGFIVEPTRSAVAQLTHNAPAMQAAEDRKMARIGETIPGFFANNLFHGGAAGYNLGFKAPIQDIRGNKKGADATRTAGLRHFNETAPGMAVSPIERGITNIQHTNNEDLKTIGIDRSAPGAQQWLQQPVMGAAGTVGLIAGLSNPASLSESITHPIETVKKPSVSLKENATNLRTNNALEILRQVEAEKQGINNATKEGMKNVAKAEATAKYGKQLNESKPTQPLLEAPKQNFTLPTQDNARYASGNKILTKQYDAEVKQINKTYNPQSVEYRNAMTELDNRYQARHADLLNGVGEFAQQTPKAKPVVNEKPVVTPVEKPVVTAKAQTTQAKQVIDNSSLKPTAGLPEAQMNTGKRGAPSAPVRAFKSVQGTLKKMGTGGVEAYNRLNKQVADKETSHAQFIQKIPTVESLTKTEIVQFADALDALSRGEKPTMSPRISQAVSEWAAAAPEIQKRAADAGLKTGNRGPYYFPRDYSNLLKSPAGMSTAAEHLVKTGQAANVEQAMGMLTEYRNGLNKRFGHLEQSRQFDLPDYQKTHEALGNYLDRAFERITKAEQFGPNGEVANELVGRMQREGYDAGIGRDQLSVALGTKEYSPAASKAASVVRQANAVTKLGTAGITNAGQSTNTIAYNGFVNTIKAAVKLLDPAERKQVEGTGVLLDHTIKRLSEGGLGTGNKIAQNLASPGFAIVERFNRLLAGESGKTRAIDLAKRGDEASIRALREKYGVTGEIGKTLTDEQLTQAARESVNRTQFKVDPKDLPAWVDTPGGKVVTQFKTFGYKQTEFIWNELLKEFGRGNPMPMVRFLATGVPVGIAEAYIKGAVKGRPAFTNPQTGEKDSAGKIVKDAVSAVGGFGMVDSLGYPISKISSKDSGKFVSAVAGTVGGPTVGTTADTLININKAKNGDTTPIKRQAAGMVPVFGARIQDKVAPFKEDQSITKPGEVATPYQLDQQSNKQLEQMGKDVKAGDNALIQLPNGKYAATINGEVKPFDTLEKARDAARKDHGLADGESGKTLGDKYYYKDENGDVKSMPQYKHEFDVADSQNQLDMYMAKDNEDYDTWLGAAKNQLTALEKLRDKYNKDSQADKVDDVQKKIETLKHNMKKYASYGGAFSKGKGVGSIKPSSYRVNTNTYNALKIGPSKAPSVSLRQASVRARGSSAKPKVTLKRLRV